MDRPMQKHPDSGFYDNGMDLQDPDLYASGQRLEDISVLPAQAYTSEMFQRLENEKVWTRDWVCIGTTAEIAHTGDLMPYTIGQHAIHVQRQTDSGLIGRFNKAQHGGCRSVPAQCQTGKKTKCSYTSCGFSRDRDVIPGGSLEDMSPLAGQYLGTVPERLLPVRVQVRGPFIFANIDPMIDQTIEPPPIAWQADILRREGVWCEYRANWKLAGSAIVASARSSGVEAQWHFPNLLVIHTLNAVAAIILQPTAMDQTLCRISYFAQPELAAFDARMAAMASILDLAATQARDMQSQFTRSSEKVAIEPPRVERGFNRKFVERITRQHISYWNAPLTDARMVC
jgi:hypothetical protein